PHYFSYEIVGSSDVCGNVTVGEIYSFRAAGDLDGDGSDSLFELSVGLNDRLEMYRAPGFFVANEIE
ncbi:MAG: hypothetical protein JRH11_23440, partial [Deltaproteobacteria bacterium]|nr:hypothetical protein [Deltaproteobacteria bacterium]